MKTLAALIRLVHLAVAAYKTRKHQNEKDKLSKDPGGWLNGHFGGVSKPRDRKAPTSEADD